MTGRMPLARTRRSVIAAGRSDWSEPCAIAASLRDRSGASDPLRISAKTS